mmetsp:Transcript_78476/g.204654  ORF Transcript_78476/g.204654 Transcript_78476/m.204654 type:complete len:297 (-) Transcript_78476:79-969(-)
MADPSDQRVAEAVEALHKAIARLDSPAVIQDLAGEAVTKLTRAINVCKGSPEVLDRAVQREDRANTLRVVLKRAERRAAKSQVKNCLTFLLQRPLWAQEARRDEKLRGDLVAFLREEECEEALCRSLEAEAGAEVPEPEPPPPEVSGPDAAAAASGPETSGGGGSGSGTSAPASASRDLQSASSHSSSRRKATRSPLSFSSLRASCAHSGRCSRNVRQFLTWLFAARLSARFSTTRSVLALSSRWTARSSTSGLPLHTLIARVSFVTASPARSWMTAGLSSRAIALWSASTASATL